MFRGWRLTLCSDMAECNMKNNDVFEDVLLVQFLMFFFVVGFVVVGGNVLLIAVDIIGNMKSKYNICCTK